jgi:hypothetical protein
MFDRVCVRTTGVGVYRGGETYLRIGPGLASELSTHRLLLRRGFPVARILEYGYRRRLPYYVEESLGPSTLGDLFAAEVDSTGGVSDASFAHFTEVLGRQIRAQARTATSGWSRAAFAELVGVARTAALHPEVAVCEGFDRATRRLARLPGTVLHGDLHPDNACLGGIIDVEGTGRGMLGYDVLTAAFVPAMCEDAGFAAGQLRGYLRHLDDVVGTVASGRLSDHLEALLMCRVIALASRRHRDREIRAIRSRVLRSSLETYRSGGSLAAGWGLDPA